jgi:hypothetical protein
MHLGARRRAYIQTLLIDGLQSVVGFVYHRAILLDDKVPGNGALIVITAAKTPRHNSACGRGQW